MNDEYRDMYLQEDPVYWEYFSRNIKKNMIKMVAEMRGSDFIFYHVDKKYYHCKKISLNRGGTFDESTD